MPMKIYKCLWKYIQSAPKFLSGTKRPLYAVVCNMHPCGQWGCLRGPWGMLRAKIFRPRRKLFVWLVFKGVLLLRTILSFPAACERGGNLSPARTRELQLSFGKLKFHSRLSENSCRLGREAFEGSKRSSSCGWPGWRTASTWGTWSPPCLAGSRRSLIGVAV